MVKEYKGRVYWLLVYKFDFFLFSFMEEFGIEEIFVIKDDKLRK